MHIPWNDVELLVAVAEARSLSAAAKLLRVTQPTISRRLAELEARISEPLFVRSVDGVVLTSLGERMLQPALRMLDCARDVDLVASGADANLRGVVRLTAPPGVAYDLLAPFAAKLRSELPDVYLEVIATVSYLDLARREADLGIRFQALDRPSAPHDLQILATLEQGVAAYATREYIASLPRGYGVAQVDWVGWAPPLENVPPNPQLAAIIPGFRPVFASDDFIVQHRAAEAGVGAIILGRFRSRLAPPTPLVDMKLDLGKRTSSLQLVCARSSLAVPRVRAVAELLSRELKASRSALAPTAPSERSARAAKIRRP
jgi:DNA-binding transcriptional LysR family regulator